MTPSPIPPDHEDAAPPPAPLKFPSVALRAGTPAPPSTRTPGPAPGDSSGVPCNGAPGAHTAGTTSGGDADEPDTAQDVLGTIDQISRRIDLLARDLGCLGYFDDDDDDRPRAA